MGLSKQHGWMIAEAVVGTVIGALNSSAGLVLTVGLVGFHICFDKKEEEELRCPLERVLNTEEVSRLHSCKGCPFREGAIDVQKVEEERE
ncbi:MULTISPECIES: hypothetical protein [unclassified Microcoleus]|uniref:hypothetical protein n=1 Tax=unclassified Microcoleus TaxID=2642155 RepID=UPI0025E4853C|nr:MULTISPECIES: hypothetical protein [unclassified Microcoleus]